MSTSLRARPVTAASSDDEAEDAVVVDSPGPPPPPPQPTMSQRAISQTLASTAQLANLLPTGTLLALQTVSPIFTNHGSCDAATRPLTAVLLGFLTASCFLASFTDSFKAPDGRIFYGFATLKGMWVFDSAQAEEAGLPDLRKYRLTAVDWIHAFVSAFVLVTVAMRDRNVVSCFYPRPSHEAQEVLDIVPLGLGLVCSLVFVVFPSKRHGIGYPINETEKLSTATLIVGDTQVVEGGRRRLRWSLPRTWLAEAVVTGASGRLQHWRVAEAVVGGLEIE